MQINKYPEEVFFRRDKHKKMPFSLYIDLKYLDEINSKNASKFKNEIYNSVMKH